MKKISKILNNVQFCDISAKTKHEALVELCGVLANDPRVIDPQRFLDALMKREKVMSTGIGMGVAIPHAKTSAVKDIVIAFGRCKQGINFESLDGSVVYIIILIGAPEHKREEFLNLIAYIGKLFTESDFKQRFLEAEYPSHMVKLVMEEFS